MTKRLIPKHNIGKVILKSAIKEFDKRGAKKLIESVFPKFRKTVEVTIDGKTTNIPEEVYIGEVKNITGDLKKAAKIAEFQPVIEISQAPNNIEFAEKVTIPRLQQYMQQRGLDVTDNIPWFLDNGMEMKQTKDVIMDAVSQPMYVGYYTNPERGKFTTGTTVPGYNKVFINVHSARPGYTMLHEGNMHRTDYFLRHASPQAKKEYEDFLLNIFKDTTPSNGKIIINGTEIKDVSGARHWYELRATLGEVVKNIYMKLANQKGLKTLVGNIEKLTPEFNEMVDNMSPEQLNFMLGNTNAYGRLYSQVGPKTYKNFDKELRRLIKYSPALLLMYDSNE